MRLGFVAEFWWLSFSKHQYREPALPIYSNRLGRRIRFHVHVYVGTPYLFISAGSGGGSGFMYLDWVIVTYGVPYVVNVS